MHLHERAGDMMGWHEIGNELENICRAELLARWPNSQIIETKCDSIHGIDFAVQLSSGGVAIVEVKSATGTVRGKQMSASWISERVQANPALEAIITNAFRRGAPVFRATYRVTNTTPARIRNASPTDQIKWEDLFGDRRRPEENSFTLLSARSEHRGNVIRVVHTFSDGITTQDHEYCLDVRQLSCALFDSTMEFRSFPFRVPHSHTVTENGQVTYSRTLNDWDGHLDSKEHLSTDNVETRHCVKCGAIFYDTSDHIRCYVCWTGTCHENSGRAARLIDEADRWSRSSDWKQAGNAIKRLQQDWKEVHPLPRTDSATLWERFNGACQAFYGARQQHHDKQDQIRRNNVQHAEHLIANAEHLSRSTEWKEAAEAIKGLQQSWKDIQPLPKGEANALWDRFSCACQSFFNARQQYHEKQDLIRRNNVRRAERLIADAERLSRSTDWKEAANAIKGLQQSWKNVHPLPKDEADALWERFSSACQSFFTARQHHHDKQDQIRRHNVQLAERLIANAERLSRSTDWKEAAAEIKDVQQDWKGIHPLPKDEADDLWRQFNEACQRFFSARSEAHERSQREWRERTSNALRKAGEAAERLEASINHDEGLISRWQDTIDNLRPGGRAEDIRYGLEHKIYEVQEKIESKRYKIRDIEASIANMRDKLDR